jgi:hypothetical protein
MSCVVRSVSPPLVSGFTGHAVRGAASRRPSRAQDQTRSSPPPLPLPRLLNPAPSRGREREGAATSKVAIGECSRDVSPWDGDGVQPPTGWAVSVSRLSEMSCCPLPSPSCEGRGSSRHCALPPSLAPAGPFGCGNGDPPAVALALIWFFPSSGWPLKAKGCMQPCTLSLVLRGAVVASQHRTERGGILSCRDAKIYFVLIGVRRAPVTFCYLIRFLGRACSSLLRGTDHGGESFLIKLTRFAC